MGNINDNSFNIIKSIVETRSEKELIMFICEQYNKWVNKDSDNITQYILNYYKEFKFWGDFNPEENNIDLIEKRVDILKNQWDSIQEMYEDLRDERSKAVLIMILENWLSFYYGKIEKIKEYNFKPYLDMDLIKVSKDEVFVDLRACGGETIEDYIDSYGNSMYKSIYAYETLEENIEKLNRNYNNNNKVIIRSVEVGNEDTVVYKTYDCSNPDQLFSIRRNKRIEVVTLDKDIEEKITFLKIDTGGNEIEILEGAKNHIQQNKPKIVVSICYSNESLIKIYEYIKGIESDYMYYLRYYGGKYIPTDYVLICIPK